MNLINKIRNIHIGVDRTDMNRRKYLARMIKIGIACTCPLYAIKPAYPGVFAGIVAFVNFAAAIGGLLSKGRTVSINDFLSMQKDFSIVISNKITVIYEQLEIVIAQLEEIQNQVQKLPSKVTDELYERKLNGVISHYVEILRVYHQDVSVYGIAKAQDNISDELENELLKPLREIRNVLLSSYSDAAREILVPMVATTLFIESNCMILANYTPTRIIESLKSYRNWFTDVTYGIPQMQHDYGDLVFRKERLTKHESEDPYCMINCTTRGGIYRKSKYFHDEVGYKINDTEEYKILKQLYASLLDVGQSAVIFCDNLIDSVGLEIRVLLEERNKAPERDYSKHTRDENYQYCIDDINRERELESERESSFNIFSSLSEEEIKKMCEHVANEVGGLSSP